MTEPNRFVGLHSHSTFSTFDAIGRPQDHIDFVLRNGGDSLALTDHGNMNGFSHQYVHSEKLKKAGVKFKPVHGVEAYFVPSLQHWKELYEADRATKAAAKALAAKSKKKGATEEPGEDEVDSQMAGTIDELNEISAIKSEDEDDSGGTIVENEEESKGTASKYKNPLFQRNHLVLLAKNDAGLKALFKIVSASAADGFYRYPRVDLDMLREHGKGNIIASTACLSGDSKLLTNYGVKTLKEIVDLISKNHELFVLGYNELLRTCQFARINWGAKTKINAHTLTIQLANGKSVRCTPDHKFLTKEGWKRADELIVGESAILTNK